MPLLFLRVTELDFLACVLAKNFEPFLFRTKLKLWLFVLRCFANCEGACDAGSIFSFGTVVFRCRKMLFIICIGFFFLDSNRSVSSFFLFSQSKGNW